MAGITQIDKFPFPHHPKHEIVKSLTCNGYIHAVARNPGDIIYSSDGITLSGLPVGQVGQVMSVDADGQPTWENAVAAGDLIGPNLATNNALVRFDQNTGKLVKNSPIIVSDNGSITGVNNITLVTINNQPPTTGDVSGPAVATANAVARFDQNTGKLLKNSSIVIADNGDITGVNNITLNTINGNNFVTSTSNFHLSNWNGLTAVIGGISAFRYTITGEIVTIEFPVVIGTSGANTTNFSTITALPASIRPQNDKIFMISAVDGVVDSTGQLVVDTFGIITIWKEINHVGQFGVGTGRGALANNITYSLA